VRLVGEDASRDKALDLSAGRLFFLKAKPTTPNLAQHMPEAVGQAVVLAELTKQNQVRFCLSNGGSWIFAVLKKGDNGERTYYESVPRYINKRSGQIQTEDSCRKVEEIVELLLQWLMPEPSCKDLYKLLE